MNRYGHHLKEVIAPWLRILGRITERPNHCVSVGLKSSVATVETLKMT